MHGEDVFEVSVIIAVGGLVILALFGFDVSAFKELAEGVIVLGFALALLLLLARSGGR